MKDYDVFLLVSYELGLKVEADSIDSAFDKAKKRIAKVKMPGDQNDRSIIVTGILAQSGENIEQEGD